MYLSYEAIDFLTKNGVNMAHLLKGVTLEELLKLTFEAGELSGRTKLKKEIAAALDFL